MADDYDSKLISDLYNSGVDEKKAIQILSEMDEIKNPIFIQPIVDAYFRFEKSTISHYFISSLQNYNDNSLPEIVMKMILSPEFKIVNLPWLLPIFKKFKLYGQIADAAISIIRDYSKNGVNDAIIASFNLSTFIDYVKASGRINEIRDDLERIVLKSSIDLDEKKIALDFLIRINPNEELKKILNNYQKYKESNTEIIMARVVSKWRNGIADDLKEFIIKNGSSRAAELIKASNESKKSDVKPTEDNENNNRSITIITEIYELRDSINNLSSLDEAIKFTVFKDNESLILQSKTPQNKAELIGYCIVIRDFVQSVSDKFKEHGLAESEIKAAGICPIDAADSALNSMELYLYSKKIGDPKKLINLRILNRLTNKTAHNDREFTKILKDLGLDSLFTENKWGELHQGILKVYVSGLQELEEILKARIKKQQVTRPVSENIKKKLNE